ncbi:hypothetical protein GCM10009555_087970 [Acrocarpospora macrocephala]|uniref:VWFA domain-containing protein n=2 Tax=Acrocarpospora macrocephala TaxID=150177 RepID=A0A5M3WK66_9ACTN|nr:hypothetical protein Amac_023660 [Acrocarpospora macrocephala]
MVVSSVSRRLAMLMSLGVVFMTAVPAEAVPIPPIEVQPIDVVILVDESGSLSASAVSQERAAASLLAVGEFSSKSRVEVVGFGSKNTPDQDALDMVCPLTPLGSREDREAILKCVQELHPRTAAEGNDTDHAAALGRALATLRDSDDDQRQKIVFLLTDGILDVQRSLNYGDSPAVRQAAAADYIQAHLTEATKLGIQVWPLGFGQADPAQLRGFAVGKPCNNMGDSKPRAQLIKDEREVFAAMVRAYAAARCAGSEVAESQTVPSGGSREYQLRIPVIATDASITVSKRNPRFKVTYIDPNGKTVPKSGAFDGSTFQVNGEDTPVEGLQIRLPRPGTWKVRVEAAQDAEPEEVVAAVTWQGAVHSSITLDSPNPDPGKEVVVRSRLQTRKGVVVADDDLSALRFSVDMTGDGVPGTVHAELNDSGTGPDRKAGDGEFAGALTIPPGASGGLEFVGIVDATGVQGDRIPYQTTVAKPGEQVRTVVDIPQQTIAPGDAATGTVTASNETGKPISATLVLADLREGDHIEVVDPDVRLAVGQSSTDVTLTLAADSAEGDVPGMLILRDAADPAKVYGQGFLKLRVAQPPSPVPWILAALTLLAVITVTYLTSRIRAARVRGDVQDLTLVLYQGDREMGPWRAPIGRNRRLTFVIRDTHTDHPYLDRPNQGDLTYEVVRAGRGAGLVLRGPGGEQYPVRPGVPQAVGDGVAIAVRDGRLDRRPEPAAGAYGSDPFDQPSHYSNDPLM